MPGSFDEIQISKVPQNLRGPRLRDTCLSRELCRAWLLILAVTEGHERADDRETARTARQ